MTVPYELYLRFLATKNLVVEDEVNEHLTLLMLPPTSQAMLDRQYQLVQTTLPRGVLSQLDNGSQGGADFLHWMKVLDIQELWTAEKPFVTPQSRVLVKLASDIHDDPKLRMTINALLMKGVKAHDIAQAVQTKYSTPIRDIHIELYRKFFFDPRRMTRNSWRAYLKVLKDQEQKIYLLALTEAVDIVRSELDLPAKVSVSALLQTMVTKTYMKARVFLEDNGAESGKEGREYISTFLAVVDKYEKYRSADTADFSQSLQLEFDFIETVFDTPDTDTILEVAERAKAKSD